MDDKDKIQQLEILCSELKLQVGLLVSRAESERDTQANSNRGHAQKDKEILELIEHKMSAIMDIFYGNDRKSGLVVDVDRNVQTLLILKWVAAISISTTIGLIIKTIFDSITKK